jgi:hypothetical protein
MLCCTNLRAAFILILALLVQPSGSLRDSVKQFALRHLIAFITITLIPFALCATWILGTNLGQVGPSKKIEHKANSEQTRTPEVQQARNEGK